MGHWLWGGEGNKITTWLEGQVMKTVDLSVPSSALRLPLVTLSCMSFVPQFPLWCCCSVAQLCPTLQDHGLQHARLPCPSPSPTYCHLLLWKTDTVWENAFQEHCAWRIVGAPCLFTYIYFWPPWVFVAACRLSLVAISRVCSLVNSMWASRCGAWVPGPAGSVVVRLSHPTACGTCPDQRWNLHPCIGRGTLNHCTPGDVQ